MRSHETDTDKIMLKFLTRFLTLLLDDIVTTATLMCVNKLAQHDQINIELVHLCYRGKLMRFRYAYPIYKVIIFFYFLTKSLSAKTFLTMTMVWLTFWNDTGDLPQD